MVARILYVKMVEMKDIDEWLFSLDKSRLVEIIIKDGMDANDSAEVMKWLENRKKKDE